jgi:hypothetical protein
MDLFTAAERRAIVDAPQTSVKLFLLMAAGASFIDLDDPRTGAGLAELVTLGLLTAVRRDAVRVGTPTAG